LGPLLDVSVRRLPCRDDAIQIYHVVIDLLYVAEVHHYLLVSIVIIIGWLQITTLVLILLLGG
jgi:hypothetical protein